MWFASSFKIDTCKILFRFCFLKKKPKFSLRLSSLLFFKKQSFGNRRPRDIIWLWFNYYLLLKLRTLCPTTEISKEIRLIIWKRICKSKVTIDKELNNKHLQRELNPCHRIKFSKPDGVHQTLTIRSSETHCL